MLQVCILYKPGRKLIILGTKLVRNRKRMWWVNTPIPTKQTMDRLSCTDCSSGTLPPFHCELSSPLHSSKDRGDRGEGKYLTVPFKRNGSASLVFLPWLDSRLCEACCKHAAEQWKYTHQVSLAALGGPYEANKWSSSGAGANSPRGRGTRWEGGRRRELKEETSNLKGNWTDKLLGVPQGSWSRRSSDSFLYSESGGTVMLIAVSQRTLIWPFSTLACSLIFQISPVLSFLACAASEEAVNEVVPLHVPFQQGLT